MVLRCLGYKFCSNFITNMREKSECQSKITNSQNCCCWYPWLHSLHLASIQPARQRWIIIILYQRISRKMKILCAKAVQNNDLLDVRHQDLMWIYEYNTLSLRPPTAALFSPGRIWHCESLRTCYRNKTSVRKIASDDHTWLFHYKDAMPKKWPKSLTRVPCSGYFSSPPPVWHWWYFLHK